MLLTNSKDPFKDTGLTVRLRGGNRDLLDGQLRYAMKLGERVAFKIAGGYIRARDFTGNNFDATSKLLEPANNPPRLEPGLRRGERVRRRRQHLWGHRWGSGRQNRIPARFLGSRPDYRQK
ncbi:hypothetical protein [Hymenobacter siberiensis]|uniref:hypothetical protein n=1 Tax=Hymenobacter siberiensis TaxID=2848396 RepID=UPI001C1DD9CA|nr:hypothetical protein [Hymenobacter siberiensis]